MSAGNRKHPGRLPAPAPSRSRVAADVAMLIWLGVMLTFLAAAYFGIIP